MATKKLRRANAKRILLLGIPGVQKSIAAQRLSQELDRLGHSYEVVNFERQYLWGTDPQQRRIFLASGMDYQRDLWLERWEKFKAQLDPDKNYILTLHGAFLDDVYGVRCVFNPGQIGSDFQPTLVLTLISDIYDAWAQTRSRIVHPSGVAQQATKAAAKIIGAPTFAQLLIARRIELLVGDQIATAAPRLATINSHDSPSPVRNLSLSVSHPIQTFINLIAGGPECRVAYLSFPIRDPRRLALANDPSAIKSVSAFVRRAFDLQLHNKLLAVQCPLAIDELPLNEVLDRLHTVGPPPAQVVFERNSLRWPLREILGSHEPLAWPPTGIAPIPVAELEEAYHLLDADVELRDYRLVDQCQFLTIFNPIIRPGRKKASRSVRAEFSRAYKQGKAVFYFQDPTIDPDNNFRNNSLQDTEEETGQLRESAHYIGCPTEDDLLDVIRAGGYVQENAPKSF